MPIEVEKNSSMSDHDRKEKKMNAKLFLSFSCSFSFSSIKWPWPILTYSSGNQLLHGIFLYGSFSYTLNSFPIGLFCLSTIYGALMRI